jgi:sugar transferase (PEP-CTERM/EpsH1 system associated)
MNAPAAPAPLVAHVVFRFDVGGLENGLVNLINDPQSARYRHAIVCLTGATDFRRRLRRSDVEIVSIGKRSGTDTAALRRVFSALRRLRPDIVHTRNSGTLECLPIAALAGVRHRIHGMHGWDVEDLDGTNRKHRLRQWLARPFVERYTAVSRHLASWLEGTIGVPPSRITQIYNGVDTTRFQAGRDPERREVLPRGFASPEALVIGGVGRMEVVKDPLTLVRGFLALLQQRPADRDRLRLVYVGGGSLRDSALGLLAQSGAADCAWLPGSRDDVPELLKAFDIFVLPSLNEGISNTILEAMACELPVVATAVGGNRELVQADVTGLLVPPRHVDSLADALGRYAGDRELAARHGAAGRARVEREFSLRGMVGRYIELYDSLLGTRADRLATGDI